MNLFERITNQLLIECEDGKHQWQQTWYNVIPKDATPPHRTEEEQECYDFAMSIIFNYADRELLGVLSSETSDRACYNWEKDVVIAPCRAQFDSDADFFGTMFHELVHSTGCKKRLNRPGFNPDCEHGEYCREELIAELGSMYLLGICCYNDGKCFEQSASYVRHYKHETGASDDALRMIARMAEKAVDYILGED